MKPRLILLITLALLVAAPLAGGLLRGLPEGFTDFPPLLHQARDVPLFSWAVFTLFAVAAVGSVLLLAAPRRFGFRPTPRPDRTEPRGRFPTWGYVGLLLNLASWACAWGRFEWLGAAHSHTFFPLWLGYILLVDALVCRRSGSSLLRRAPRHLLVLFPASSLTWWYFEFINRLVHNWWYEGAEVFTAGRYVFHATLCFSTVLPAVFETRELLMTLPWFQRSYRGARPMGLQPGFGNALIMALGVAGLVILGAVPEQTFFLTWVAPLLVLFAGLVWADPGEPFRDLREGDYTRMLSLAASALVCGFFWELWNYGSMPKWHYSVPYVNRFHVFEMPIVGYAGYLPFGPICWFFWVVLRKLVGGRDGATQPDVPA